MKTVVKTRLHLSKNREIEIDNAAIEVHRNAFGDFWFYVLGHNASTGKWEAIFNTKSIEEAWAEKAVLACSLKSDVLFMGVAKT